MVGGAQGDRLGRRRVFVLAVIIGVAQTSSATRTIPTMVKAGGTAPVAA